MKKIEKYFSKIIDNETDLNSFLELCKFEEKYKNYIFRGQSNGIIIKKNSVIKKDEYEFVEWELKSSFRRNNEGMFQNQSNINYVFDNFKKQKKWKSLKNDTLIFHSTLQHIGKSTNLIDFTKDIKIALYFAFDYDELNVHDENYVTIFLINKKTLKSETNDLDFLLDDASQHLYSLSFETIENKTSMINTAINRMKAQKACFILDCKNIIDLLDINTIRISYKFKNKIKEFLNENEISVSIIYPDEEGQLKYLLDNEIIYILEKLKKFELTNIHGKYIKINNVLNTLNQKHNSDYLLIDCLDFWINELLYYNENYFNNEKHLEELQIKIIDNIQKIITNIKNDLLKHIFLIFKWKDFLKAINHRKYFKIILSEGYNLINYITDKKNNGIIYDDCSFNTNEQLEMVKQFLNEIIYENIKDNKIMQNDVINYIYLSGNEFENSLKKNIFDFLNINLKNNFNIKWETQKSNILSQKKINFDSDNLKKILIINNQYDKHYDNRKLKISIETEKLILEKNICVLTTKYIFYNYLKKGNYNFLLKIFRNTGIFDVQNNISQQFNI